MPDKKPNKIRIYGTLIILAALTGSYFLQSDTLDFKPDVLTNLPTLIGYLLLVSVFIERTIEIFLSAWRSEGADIMDNRINWLVNEIKLINEKKPAGFQLKLDALELEWKELKEKRTIYSAESRVISLWIGLILGVLVAFIGVRVLGNIVEAGTLKGVYKGIFIIVDVLLTGSVLAGGSEAFNKITKVYYSVMGKTAERAKGNP